MGDTEPITLIWMRSSKRDLLGFPLPVIRAVGFALHQAQVGQVHVDAKPLKGFGGASVMEIVERHDGDTYRAVYTVRFKTAVYVLHAFQKKAKKGIATPKADIDLIRIRLREAAELERIRQNEEPK